MTDDKKLWCCAVTDWVTASKCKDCDDILCENHPKRLSELRDLQSSKFAEDIKRRMAAHFGLTPKDVENKLKDLFSKMQKMSIETMQDLVLSAVRSWIATEFRQLAQKYVRDEFDKALNAEVLMLDPENKVTNATIQRYVAEAVQRLLKKHTGMRGIQQNEYIDKVIARIVKHRVDKATSEFLAETVEKFNRDAMKRIMEGMAKAIAADKRLLAVIGQ